jgi:hypothetical protein
VLGASADGYEVDDGAEAQVFVTCAVAGGAVNEANL